MHSVGRLSAAACDLAGGPVARWGAPGRFITASTVKVGIAAALLLAAQDDRRRLTPDERAAVGAMLRVSDNDAASALWAQLGGRRGVDAAHRRLGLVETAAAPGGWWGLTRTTADDQLALLRAVFAEPSPLGRQSRRWLGALLGTVAPEQRWGVTAASSAPAEVKNGWVPRSATGLWCVNSVGRIRRDGPEVLVAVLSDGQPSMAVGVAAVEDAARAVVRRLREPGAGRPGPDRSGGRA
ncbi:serine hydrolase [Streptomyces sp. 549]|uniref:serine hydrolase n=1 Tax=Streptomyces sp. 549 TaxID=3049076 RepID=UPI0024C394C8|nr:serine hydrolase [Streptomyces sp. 549]MDK1473502.1 serine hydrolase [Streptomyces sp. 549]